MKLLIINTHPIEYHVNLYRLLNKEFKDNFKVLYLWDRYKNYSKERRPNQSFIENNYLPFDLRDDLLEGYSYEFITNYNKKARYGFFDFFSFGLFKKIKLFKPNYLIFYGYNNLISIIVLLFCKFNKIKFILKGEVTKDSNKKEKFFIKLYKKIFFYLCDCIAYSCNKNLNYFKSFTPKKKFINMPCAVNNQTLQQIKKEMSYRKVKTELNKESFNFIYAGKFIERKNLDFMIEHFITTFKSNKNYKLNLIGNGIKENYLKQKYSKHTDKVKFINHMGYKDLYQNLSTANVLVVTSHYDPSPKIINECLNFEIPIISADSVGTTGDLVIDGFNGYIFKKDDKLSYINALKKITIKENYNFLKTNCLISLKAWKDEISVKELINLE